MQLVAGGNELLDTKKILQQAGVGFGQVVADLGCGGNGLFSLAAARLVGDKGTVFAVDILKNALANVAGKAKLEGLDNVRTIWTNLELYQATKIPAASLDIALLINILFQTKRHADVLRETYRLMRPGGKLLVVDWKKTNRAPFGPPANYRLDPTDISDIAAGLGLKRQAMFDAGRYHFGLLFQK